MSSVVVVGTQWGDEGKGKVTDFLSQNAEVIARYQGGNNAGHTIQFANTTYKLHLIPSGIFYADKTCLLGNGMVIDPKALINEIAYLQEHNIATDNLRISNRAHIILPYHITLDALQEEAKGVHQIGTTKKGIGPAYVDKVARCGIRVADLLDKETFRMKLEHNLQEKNRWLEKLYGVAPFEVADILETYYEYGQQLAPYVCDTSVILNEALDDSHRVLFEGAQGVMLDIDQGTYPYVTSSSPIAGGVTIGTGVGPSKIDHVVGVSKAYTTRVGDGPFPTELQDETGQQIRETGREYGTTTGRPRRVGWFDSVVVRHAQRVSGITDLSLNSLDVLTGLDTVKICVAYTFQGETIYEFPANLNKLAECEPVYEEMPGWHEDITGVTDIKDLPENARHYLERISQLTDIPLVMFSVGPDRKQTHVIHDMAGGFLQAP